MIPKAPDRVQQQRDADSRAAQGRIDTARANAKEQHEAAAKDKEHGGKGGKKKAAENAPA